MSHQHLSSNSFLNHPCLGSVGMVISGTEDYSGQGCSLVDHLPSTHKVLGIITTQTKKKEVLWGLTHRVVMTITNTFCSHTISQKSR
jgi:hypothetical protein